MKSSFMQHSKSMALASLVASSLVLSGCGGSGSLATASGGTLVASKGVITGFGSVYVNGIKFETSNSSFSVDDTVDTNQENLRVGMVVTVNGTVNADGTTGSANFIQYDNELKGPIASVTVIDAFTKQLVVLGITITVSSDTVFDHDNALEGSLSFATLGVAAVGDIIEVSGFVTSATTITATHIEKQDGTGEIEILGSIATISGTSLSDFTFKVRGLDVLTTAATVLDDITVSDIANGLFIEVKGDLTGSTLTATKIKAKTKGLGKNDLDEAEVEGVISAYDAANNTFEIQGQKIDASSATLFPSSLVLADGKTAEASGAVVNGVLVAQKIKQKGNKIKIKAKISAVASDSVTFRFNATDIVVRVNQQTQIEDDNDNTLALSALAVDDYVEMKAFDDGTSIINAFEIKRKLSANKVKVKAAIEAFNATNPSITVLGIVFDLSNVVFNTSSASSLVINSSFFDTVKIGLFVEFEDSDMNGSMDTIKFDD